MELVTVYGAPGTAQETPTSTKVGRAGGVDVKRADVYTTPLDFGWVVCHDCLNSTMHINGSFSTWAQHSWVCFWQLHACILLLPPVHYRFCPCG